MAGTEAPDLLGSDAASRELFAEDCDNLVRLSPRQVGETIPIYCGWHDKFDRFLHLTWSAFDCLVPGTHASVQLALIFLALLARASDAVRIGLI
jgi:hypothetical protein